MKKSLSLLLALGMVAGSLSSVAAAADDNALTTEQKYQQLVDNKILEGTTDGQSHLSDNLTRAQFATIAVKIAGLAEDASSASVFKDVKAGQWWTGAINAAKTAGLVDGIGGGLFSPKADVTVQEVIKVADAIAKLTPVEGATVEGSAAWAGPYIKAAQDAGLPVPSTGFTAPATRAQAIDLAYAVFQAAAAPQLSDVKAVVNSDNTVTVTGKVTGKSDSVKVTVGQNAAAAATVKEDGTFTYTSGALAIGNYDVSVVGYNGSAASIAAKASVAVTTFGVVSATPLSATQLSVVFSKAVDSTDATTVARYTVNGTSPSSVSLASDGVTATLTFASATTLTTANAVLVVSPVKLSGNSDVSSAAYTQVLNYTDSVKPTIASVSAKTNGTVATSLTITTSEPVTAAGVKVDGAYSATGNVAFSGNTITVSNLSLDASKTHTLELINLTDAASPANVTVTASQTFSVTVDTAAPTVTLSSTSDKNIVVTFSKDMNVASVQAAFAASVGVKDEGLGNVNHLVAAQDGGTSAKVFNIAITDALYASKTSRTLTLVFPNTIQDSLGNAIAATTASVTLNKDTVKPASTGYKFVKNSAGQVTDIVVSFNEGLLAHAAGPVAGLNIVNMNGVDVTSTLLGGLTLQAVAAGDKQITLHANTPASPVGQYALSLPGGLLADQSESANTNDGVGVTLNFGTSASAFDLSSVTAAGNVITVNFGRGVKGGAVANSATDLNNYMLAGKPLTNATIVLDSTQNIATITLNSGSVDASDTTAVLAINNVMSLNGETLNSTLKTVSVTDNTKPVLKTAVLNADGTITIGFSEGLTVNPVAADLVVTSNGSATLSSAYTVTKILAGADAGKYLVALGSGTWYTSASLSIATASSGITGADAAGNTLATSTSVAIK